MAKTFLFGILFIVVLNVTAQDNKATEVFWGKQNVIKDFLTYALHKEMKWYYDFCVERNMPTTKEKNVLIGKGIPWDCLPKVLPDSFIPIYIDPCDKKNNHLLRKKDGLGGISMSTLKLSGEYLSIYLFSASHTYKRGFLGKGKYNRLYSPEGKTYAFKYNSQTGKWEPMDTLPPTSRDTIISYLKNNIRSYSSYTSYGLYIPDNIEECLAQLDTVLSNELKKQIKEADSSEKIKDNNELLRTYLRNRWFSTSNTNNFQLYMEKRGILYMSITLKIIELYHDYLNGNNASWKAFHENVVTKKEDTPELK